MASSTKGVSLFPECGNAPRMHKKRLRTANWETGTTIEVREQYSQLRMRKEGGFTFFLSFLHHCLGLKNKFSLQFGGIKSVIVKDKQVEEK